ncbi:jerky-like protein [Trichonephila clavipes]|nr:jerky-like protein [Trichonephila clavipes]
MEVNKEKIRYILQFDKGQNAIQATEIVNGVYSADTVTANYLQFWFRRFRSVIFDVKDAPHTGISDIKKTRLETILNFVSKLDSEDGSKKKKTKRKANDVILDHALYLWFSQRRSKGDPISGPLLCEKALKFNEN